MVCTWETRFLMGSHKQRDVFSLLRITFNSIYIVDVFFCINQRLNTSTHNKVFFLCLSIAIEAPVAYSEGLLAAPVSYRREHPSVSMLEKQTRVGPGQPGLNG